MASGVETEKMQEENWELTTKEAQKGGDQRKSRRQIKKDIIPSTLS